MVTLDQHRSALDPQTSLRRTLAPDSDTLLFRGAQVHVAGWAKRFQFREEQLQMPVGSLSGGERARAAIAGLMLAEADLLALDEPTNDLDIPTLEALEETLLDFPGALVLVTHDRHLLDRVCNVVVGLDGDGRAALYADYHQWEQTRAERRKSALREDAVRPGPARTSAKPSKKLSYHEQREWDDFEDRILAAEAELQAATADLDNPVGISDHQVVADRHERIQLAQREVDGLYERWAELGAKQQA
jgi:ATP-binding cassette subfamily F protein uup